MSSRASRKRQTFFSADHFGGFMPTGTSFRSPRIGWSAGAAPGFGPPFPLSAIICRLRHKNTPLRHYALELETGCALKQDVCAHFVYSQRVVAREAGSVPFLRVAATEAFVHTGTLLALHGLILYKLCRRAHPPWPASNRLIQFGAMLRYKPSKIIRGCPTYMRYSSCVCQRASMSTLAS